MKTLRRWFFEWRINRYLKLRRKGAGNTKGTFRRALFFDMDRLAFIMIQLYRGNESPFQVGLIFGPSLGICVAAVVICHDLYPWVSEGYQPLIAQFMKDATQHNWGAVRDPAYLFFRNWPSANLLLEAKTK